MLETYLAAVGALALGLGLASRTLRHLPLSEPLVALLLGVVIGPAVLGVVRVQPAAAALPTVSELSLAVAVMAVALRHPLRDIRRHVRSLVVLLTVVLAGMALVAGGLGMLLLGLSLPAAAVLGATMAPTDPVLAAGVVTGEPAERTLPERVRLVISVESGANDGLAFAFVAVAVAGASGLSLLDEVGRAALEAAIALGLGAAIGWGAGRLLIWSDRHRDLEHGVFLTLTIVLALLTLGVVELAGGQGVLGVLVAGLAYDDQISDPERREEWEIQEAVNRYLVLPVFTLLGVALPWPAWGDLGWAGPAFAVAVLALRRPPLVALLRRPLRLDRPSAAFVGWFGPVGVAALFYLTEVRETPAADPAIWAAGTLVIAASTLAHGVTAAPARALFARRHGPDPAR